MTRAVLLYATTSELGMAYVSQSLSQVHISSHLYVAGNHGIKAGTKYLAGQSKFGRAIYKR